MGDNICLCPPNYYGDNCNVTSKYYFATEDKEPFVVRFCLFIFKKLAPSPYL